MDYKRIEDLVEKYWACETSIVEEKELRAFFKNEQVPEKLKETALLFQYFELEGSQKKLGADFDQQLLHQLENNEPKKKTVVVHWFTPYAKVAAVVIIVAGLSFLVTRTIRQAEKETQLTDTFERPEDAFEETKKALLLISNKIGKGKTQMVKLSEFSKTEEKIKNDNIAL